MSTNYSITPVHIWFCCICKMRIYEESSDNIDLLHKCNLFSHPYSENSDSIRHISMHRVCYKIFLKEQLPSEAEIMHSILCYHINPISCTLGKLKCRCNLEIKEDLSRMSVQNLYPFYGLYSHLYKTIYNHANKDNSVAHSEGLNTVEGCFVPFCKEVAREIYSQRVSSKMISYNGSCDSTNFRYLKGSFPANSDLKIANFTMTSQKYTHKEGFQVLEKLGEGSKGAVSLACTENGELFAIKTFRDKLCLDLSPTTNEESILSSLNHSNIVQCYGGFELHDNNVLFLEYARCDILSKLIQFQEGLDPFQVLFYLRQLSSAISYLHNKNIIHRDIKAENVLLFNVGYTCKLTDFSEATYINSYTGAKRFRTPQPQEQSTIHGTPLYYAPEMAFGWGSSPESDIWSLGILTYQMLCPTLPHTLFCQNTYSHISSTNENQHHASIQTMRHFFSSIQQSYFRNHLTSYLESKHGSLLSKLIDFMLCLDKPRRRSAYDILNTILSDKIYQNSFIQEFKIIDCCEECRNLSLLYDCDSIINIEYNKKKSCSALIHYGVKCFYRYDGNNDYTFRIRLFTDWQFWFCFTFDFQPKYSHFLIYFLMPLIGATNHEDLILLKFDEESHTFLENSPQKFDSLCYSSYYCFLSNELFIHNTIIEPSVSSNI